MRLPRVRFTIRRLMLVVAASALVVMAVMTPARLRERRAHFRAEAARHEEEAYAAGLLADTTALEIKGLPWDAEMMRSSFGVNAYYTPEQKQRRAERVLASEGRLRDEQARYARLAAYHDTLRLKYERAAARPWWRVEPDPPEPPQVTRPETPKLPPGFGINATR